MDQSYRAILGILALMITLTVADESWNQAPPICEHGGTLLEAGHRCHWPDAHFKCDCVPGAFCNTTTCQCHVGMTGHFCKQACPYSLAAPYRCLSDCMYADCSVGSTCEQTDDACYCMDGYTGPDCNLCDARSLPEVCTLCGGLTCWNGAKCDMKIDTCHCPEGYLDPPNKRDCSYCNPRVHWDRCLQHCMYDCNLGSCDTIRGTCRCPKSYSGHDCSICNPEMNTNQCADSCGGVVCMNDGLCNITKKACECAPGYYGPDCGFCNQTSSKQLCSSYCQDFCKNGNCDTTLRQCVCDIGYEGVGCERCIPSRHPGRCQKHCPFECLNNGYCDTATGQCACPQGYLGEDCSVCDPKIHLSNCTSHCHLSCINNSTCDTLSQSCECLPGWEGQACHSVCLKGYFGKNCSNSCSCRGWPCDHITGECFIETTTALLTTAASTTTEDVTSAGSTKVFLAPQIPTVAEPGSNLSSTNLLETPSAIFLLAFFTALLLLLIVLSAVLYGRRHKRNQFLQPTHEDVPLNNIVIPISNRNSVEDGDPENISADTPLYEDDQLSRPLSNSFRTSVTEEGEVHQSAAQTKPNPRKSTNLDVDAQRFYAKEANAQNFEAFTEPQKQNQWNMNIFNEKEALTKDKLKTSNYEDPIDLDGADGTEEQLKKEASEGDLEKDGGHFVALRDSVDTSSEDQVEGAVGGCMESSHIIKGHKQVKFDSEMDSANSDPEAMGQGNFPIYASVDFSKKKDVESNQTLDLEPDLKPDYQHLQHSIGRDPMVVDPSYSCLELPQARSAKDGYSRLDHGPKRKLSPVRKTVNENQYEELRREASDSSETEGE